MKIFELNFSDMLGRKAARYGFGKPNEEAPLVYIFNGTDECATFSTAIQLVCSSKYDSLQKLQPIWDGIKGGCVEIGFVLSRQTQVPDNAAKEDHSSDSDVPCTSKQAQHRAEARKKNRAASASVKKYVVKARRTFDNEHSLLIEYNVNSGPVRQCSVETFNMRCFSCTDIIFPQLSALAHDDYQNGRWLELLSNNEYVYQGKDENHLVIKFCEMYAKRNINLEDPLCQMTTAYLIARYSLNRTRIAQLIQIFRDIRIIFEYLTFAEYTVWFVLPQLYGNGSDISDITTDNIDFDSMQTLIQVKCSRGAENSSPKYPWTDATGYVRELFLIAVQLAFGFTCQQNVVYLHNIESVYRHQSFEYARSVYAHSRSGGKELFPIKNYLQRIVDACVKCTLTCIIEFNGGVLTPLKNCFFHRVKKVIPREPQYRPKGTAKRHLVSENTEFVLPFL